MAAIVVSMLLVFISKRALKADERDRPMRYIAHRIVTHRGTRFTAADVTRAGFTGTTLTHSDMSEAVLEDSVWDPGKGPGTFDPGCTGCSRRYPIRVGPAAGGGGGWTESWWTPWSGEGSSPRTSTPRSARRTK